MDDGTRLENLVFHNQAILTVLMQGFGVAVCSLINDFYVNCSRSRFNQRPCSWDHGGAFLTKMERFKIITRRRSQSSINRYYTMVLVEQSACPVENFVY